MARTNNLTNFLTDVATAIKTKKGDDTPIPASNFDTEIANLPSGGEDINEYILEKTSQTGSNNFFLNLFIKKVPELDMTNFTAMNNMFYGAFYLEEVNYKNTNNVTNMSGTFYNCTALRTIPQTDTSKVTNFSNMFYVNSSVGLRKSSLEYLPNIDMSSAVNVNSMFKILNGTNKTLTDIGGFSNLGKAYSTTTSANSSNYTLDLSQCTGLTEQSLINVLNGLYDIATKGCNVQKCTLSATNLAKLTSEEGQQALANAQTKGWTIS